MGESEHKQIQSTTWLFAMENKFKPGNLVSLRDRHGEERVKGVLLRSERIDRSNTHFIDILVSGKIEKYIIDDSEFTLNLKSTLSLELI